MPTKTVKKEKPAEKKEIKNPKTDSYIYKVGRRKSSVAQVRLYKKGKGEITVNKQDYKKYFPSFEFQEILIAPLKLINKDKAVSITAIVKGGGVRGQAEAIRLGISRALIELDKEYRAILKAEGFLTRDSRVKERKKPGLKRARRAPQWSKR